jgi:hypothetical protein
LATGCEHRSGSEDADWLKDLENPFITGTWISDPDSDGATLTITGKPDGTFTYAMENVPTEYESVKNGTGAYLIHEDIMVSYFPFDLLKINRFEVVDNNTIDVIEITDVKTDGTLVQGEANRFTRVHGSAVNKKDFPIVLDHPFLGKWKFDNTIENVHYLAVYDIKADGTMYYDFSIAGVPYEPETSVYLILNEHFVIYDHTGEQSVESGTLVMSDENTLTMSGEEGTVTLTRVTE